MARDPSMSEIGERWLASAKAGMPNIRPTTAKIAAGVQSHLTYVGFLAIFVFFAVTLHDGGFLTSANLLNIIRQSAVISVMAIGMTFCLSVGEIDLSIGSVLALSAITAAMVVQQAGVVVAAAAGMGVGLAVGLWNGVLVTKLRIPSFLVTLGTMGVVEGIARLASNLQSMPIGDSAYNDVFGSGDVGPVSTIFIWTGLVLLMGHIALKKIPFGREVLATGGNPIAARFSGVNIGRIKLAALLITSSTAALAGLITAGRLHGARYDLGQTLLMDVIAATVIGGTSLFGGRGTVVGAVVGALLMGTLTNGLILMGFSVSGQMIARGLIIIAAVAMSLRATEES
jgi:ribose transport system permease protein